MDTSQNFTMPRGAGLPRNALAVARGLGWFSIGLGAAELLAPRRLARAIGLPGREALVTSYGVREVVTGIGILADKDPTAWMWGRFGGDGLDLGTLVLGLFGRGAARRGASLAVLAVAGVTVLDLFCAQALSAAKRPASPPLRDYSGRSGFPRGRPRPKAPETSAEAARSTPN